MSKNTSNRIDSFSNRLRTALNDRDITAAELAKKTGLSKAQLSQYTNGIYEAKQQALFQLAQALNVSEAWLMGYDVPMEKEKPQKMWDDFDLKCNPEKVACEASLMEFLQKQYGKKVVQMLMAFAELNDVGQDEAVKRVDELTEIAKYTEQKGQESLNA